jgi:serine/threonine protein kinase
MWLHSLRPRLAVRGNAGDRPWRLQVRTCSSTPETVDIQQLTLLNLQKEYWQGVSEQAKTFVRNCLTIDPTNRPTAEELLQDSWLQNVEDHYVATPQGSATDLLPQVKKAFDARKTCTSTICPSRIRCIANTSYWRLLQSERQCWE